MSLHPTEPTTRNRVWYTRRSVERVYHRRDCPALRRANWWHVRTTTIEGTRTRGLYPCEVCRPPDPDRFLERPAGEVTR